jgi:hypothetical protein
VAHIIAGDGALQHLMTALVLEFGQVNAYHDQAVAEALFERPEFVADVEAVEAAERPEIQEDDPLLRL